MEKNPLEEMTSKYRKLKLLESKYMADDLSKLETHKNIVKLLEELKTELETFERNFSEEYNTWKYKAIANRKYIEVMDNEHLLNILCIAANMIEPNYSVKTIKVAEIINPTYNAHFLNFGTISILSDNETLSRFQDKEKAYYSTTIIKELIKLTKEKKSFIMSSNLANEYDGEYVKEKIASLDKKDLIISVNPGDPLDECINKFAMYATKYGSDFNEKKVNAVANLINYQPVKTRKLTNNKYIKYYDSSKGE